MQDARTLRMFQSDQRERGRREEYSRVGCGPPALTFRHIDCGIKRCED